MIPIMFASVSCLAVLAMAWHIIHHRHSWIIVQQQVIAPRSDSWAEDTKLQGADSIAKWMKYCHKYETGWTIVTYQCSGCGDHKQTELLGALT